MREWIDIIRHSLLEANTIRIGLNRLFRLTSRQQLLSLLERFPALRGWTTADGEVWVWNAEKFSHSHTSRYIPRYEKPVYFWSEAAPEIEFEQNGGRDAVMQCGDFLFDMWVVGDRKDEEIERAKRTCPVMARILPD